MSIIQLFFFIATFDELNGQDIIYCSVCSTFNFNILKIKFVTKTFDFLHKISNEVP